MVIARTKLTLEDPLIRVDPYYIWLNYKGPGPERFYAKLAELIPLIYGVERGQVLERTFNWDTLGDTQKFEVFWEITKPLDRFSYYRMTVEFSGQCTKGQGEARIRLFGCIRTEYPQDTLWQRSIFYEILRMLWHTMFYRTARLKYLHEGRALLRNFEIEVKKLFEDFRLG
ncbi:MAG: hypothetical protein V1731_01170 [Candidatus Aenigmatarchaeota archaeon]